MQCLRYYLGRQDQNNSNCARGDNGGSRERNGSRRPRLVLGLIEGQELRTQSEKNERSSECQRASRKRMRRSIELPESGYREHDRNRDERRNSTSLIR